MILIADSGSTKTAWRLIKSDSEIKQAETGGLNPLHLSDPEMTDVLTRELSFPRDSIREVYFYGAGIIDENVKSRVYSVLSNVFTAAELHVENDLLGVARGICGHEPGIACILGTGANSCYYDGEQIAYKVPSLGYILGDEGSGSWLGKEWLAAFVRRELPDNLHDKFVKRFDLDRSAIINRVYQHGNAARFLASFSKFMFQNRNEPYIAELVYRGFILFFQKNVMNYDGYSNIPVHFSGSVAFYYSTLLRKAATDCGIHIKNIVEGPVAGLTLYHLNK